MSKHLNYPAKGLSRLSSLLCIPLVCGLLTLFGACQEGPGGVSTIAGIVLVNEINVLGQVVAEYPALEERVYLIYGDEPGFGDDTRTHFDGTFRFENLRKGDYRVYAYSDCDGCEAGKEAVLVDVSVSSNGETQVPTIIIRDNLF